MFYKNKILKTVVIKYDPKINPLDYKSICKKIIRRYDKFNLVLTVEKEDFSEFDIAKLRIIQKVLSELKQSFVFEIYSKDSYYLLKPFGINLNLKKLISRVSESVYIPTEVMTPDQEFSFLKDFFCFWRKNKLFGDLHLDFFNFLKISCFLFFCSYFAIYIADAKAELVFSPKSNRIEHVIKIPFGESDSEDFLIQTKKIEDYSKTYKFQAPAEVNSSEALTASAKIVNPTNEQITLNPYTPFRSKEGYIYRNTKLIIVPPINSEGVFGEALFELKPDLYSGESIYVGDRVSLSSGTKLFLQSHTDLNVELTQSLKASSGAKSYKLSQEDIDASKEFIKNDFLQNYKVLLKDYLVESVKSENLLILENKKLLENVEYNFSIDVKNLEKNGEYLVRVNPLIDVEVVDFKNVTTFVKRYMESQTSPNHSLSSIDLKNINIEKTFATLNDGQKIAQLIFNVYATETYDTTDSEKEASKFAFISNDVIGLTKSEVVDTLNDLNFIKLESVKISPFWMPQLPNNPSKIEIKFQNE